MSSVSLVIGYGNPLRSDDGLGWIVAQRLAESQLPGSTRVVAVHQLAPELAEPISQSGLVIFVDAREGERPGRIDRRVIVPTGSSSLTFSHDIDPPALLDLARVLYGARPTAVVVSVDGKDFGYGTTLSGVAEAAVPEVVQCVRDVLTDGVAAVCPPLADGARRRSSGG